MSSAAQFSRELAARAIDAEREAARKIADQRQAEVMRHQQQVSAEQAKAAADEYRRRIAEAEAAALAKTEQEANIKAGDEYAAMLRLARQIEARAMSSGPSPAAFVLGFLSAVALVVAIVWRLFL